MKTCTTCGRELPLADFHRNGDRGLHTSCKSCHYERTKAWRVVNAERSKQLNSESARRQHERAKMTVIDAYGGSCTCCGERDPHFLTVEHITAEASKRHRYESGKRISGTKLLRVIAREGFPEDITVLCHNCNSARGQYGGCPHQVNFERRYGREVTV